MFLNFGRITLILISWKLLKKVLTGIIWLVRDPVADSERFDKKKGPVYF